MEGDSDEWKKSTLLKLRDVSSTTTKDLRSGNGHRRQWGGRGLEDAARSLCKESTACTSSSLVLASYKETSHASLVLHRK